MDASGSDEAELILRRAATLEEHFARRDVGDEELAQKFTAVQRRRFLAHYAQHGRVGHAAHVAGVTATAVYYAAKCFPAFREAVEEAKLIFRDFLFQEGKRRAMEGELDVVVSAGQVVTIDMLDEHGNPVYHRDPITNEILLNHKTGQPIVRQKPLLRRVKSDRLMELYLKAHIEDFKDKQQHEHTFKGGVLRVEAPLSEEEWEKRLAANREQSAAAIPTAPGQELLPAPATKPSVTR